MRKIQTALTLLVAATFLLPAVADAKKKKRRRHFSICEQTAIQQARGCELEAKEDRHVNLAICLNFTDPDEREECLDEAGEAFHETAELCKEQTEARFLLCAQPGMAGAYDPDLDPNDFVVGIDNPYTPFRVGSVWVYEKDGEDGLETIQVEVLPDTFEIEGIEATQIRDRVWVDGELVEDTIDWLAQDVDGNVWYLGEIALNFEDGRLVDIDGSWLTGVDGAKPGFWMKGDPQVGEFYRQEWLAGDAEDVAEVISLDADVVVPFDNGNPILQTRDFTPIEPGVEEFKFYVPGVGLVMEVDPESGETLELLSYTP